ncbi:hypothetical protein [Nonomuraea sp. NPDC050310]|uniref:hypothetical protein n=1 Tax=Nonomuraea sp. NPDC050310 TaxID=3154935 RepID=UPI0034019269
MSGLIAPDGSEAFASLERVWIGAGDLSVFTGRLEPIRDRAEPVWERAAINDWSAAVPTPGHTSGHTTSSSNHHRWLRRNRVVDIDYSKNDS